MSLKNILKTKKQTKITIFQCYLKEIGLLLHLAVQLRTTFNCISSTSDNIAQTRHSFSRDDRGQETVRSCDPNRSIAFKNRFKSDTLLSNGLEREREKVKLSPILD